MSKQLDVEHAFDMGGVAAMVTAIQCFEIMPTLTKEEMLESLRQMVNELDPDGKMRARMEINKNNEDPLAILLKAIFG